MKERGVEDATVREAEKLGHFFQVTMDWIANWIEAEQDQERQVTSLARQPPSGRRSQGPR